MDTTLLDMIRNTTVESLENVRGDFDDVPVATYRPRVPREMQRVVDAEVADRKANGPVAIPNMNAGLITPGHADDRPFQVSVTDRRSERQAALMASLIEQLREFDEETARKAWVYTNNMTNHSAWTPGRDGNASMWIGRMISKVRELKTAKLVAPTSVVETAGDIPWVRTDRNGKAMPQYFAVDLDDTTKFYKIKPGRKPGFYFIEAQASDSFFDVRNAATKAGIIAAIINAGPAACMERYGQEIGSCGRCHRTLTDATSRARGIGPECEGKM